MNFSYWDQYELMKPVDYLIIGSGITGLTTAIHLKRAEPKKQVAIFERGMLPWGASTRNAGFACFGSMGELVMDLKHHSTAEVIELLEQRKAGLELLNSLVGSKMELELCGNYEVFRYNEREDWQRLKAEIPRINDLLLSVFGQEVFSESEADFGFKEVAGMIYNRYEGMLNTGKMMRALLELAQAEDVKIYNGAAVNQFEEQAHGLEISLSNGLKIKAQKMLLCTNAFSGALLKLPALSPARNQVLITKPIKNLPFKGAFHAESGHLYYRTVGNRVLIGGGRQHFKAEQNTTDLKITDEVQQYLEKQLREVILPQCTFEVEQRWAGIIGLGEKKTPLIEKLSDRIYAGVRLGGMGVALGSLVGKELSALAVRG
jgi:glycine/D-amino acid oxidase-like deaminating enzyme